jgi:hypothetical protein
MLLKAQPVPVQPKKATILSIIGLFIYFVTVLFCYGVKKNAAEFRSRNARWKDENEGRIVSNHRI